MTAFEMEIPPWLKKLAPCCWCSTYELKVDRSLGYAGGEYSANRSGAVQIFTKANNNDADVNIPEAYAKNEHVADIKQNSETKWPESTAVA